MRAGFIHIPYLPQQAAQHPGTASMKLDEVIEGLRIAVRTTVAHTVDVRQAGGLTH
jgi:pyroglutamyl-peptidase